MRMTSEAAYRDGTYLADNPTWHEEDSAWKATQIQRLLQANAVDPATVCEIGCGAGEVLTRLASFYDSDVVFSGYEISPQAFEICRHKEASNVRFYHGDALTLRDASFDVVMAIDVVEHVEGHLEFLRQIRTRGTYKVFHIPLDLSVQTVLRVSPLLRYRATVGHIHYFVKETALAALADTGYEIINYFYTAGALDLPHGSRKARALRLPRRMLFSLNQDLTVRLLGGFSLLVLAK